MEPKDPHPALPQLRLDDLLAELQTRLQAVLDTRDRVYTLLEAVVAVGTNLDLETVLRQIVEAAITLVRARYGALGVIGEGGRPGRIRPGRPGRRPDRGDPSLAGGPRPARRADHRPAPAAAARHLRQPQVVRLPARASADAHLPRRPGADPRRGLRQPLPDREGGRRRVRRGGRGAARRAGRRGRRGDRQRQAVRGGPPAAALAAGQRRGDQAAAVRGPRRTRCWPWSPSRRWRCPARTWSRWPCRPRTASSWSSSMRRGRARRRPSGWCCPVSASVSGEVLASGKR